MNGGGRNALCANAEQKAPAGFENQAGVGLLLTYGRFTFLDLIDMDWSTELELACPVNKVGAVTLFQTNRHGSWDGAGAPAFLGAIRPQVIVFNNGPRKGLGQVDNNAKTTTAPRVKVPPYERNGYARAAALPGVEGIWQGHLSLLDKDPKHNTSPDMIANLEETAEPGALDQASGERSGRHDRQQEERVQQDLHGPLTVPARHRRPTGGSERTRPTGLTAPTQRIGSAHCRPAPTCSLGIVARAARSSIHSRGTPVSSAPLQRQACRTAPLMRLTCLTIRNTANATIRNPITSLMNWP